MESSDCSWGDYNLTTYNVVPTANLYKSQQQSERGPNITGADNGELTLDIDLVSIVKIPYGIETKYCYHKHVRFENYVPVLRAGYVFFKNILQWL